MIKLENLLKRLSLANTEHASILNETMMTREQAEEVLSSWGLSLRDLNPPCQTPLATYLDDPDNYDIGLRNLHIDLCEGNRVLFAEVGVQYKRIPYFPQLTPLGMVLKELNLLPQMPRTTRDLPMYFPSTALIDKPEYAASESEKQCATTP